MRKIRENCAGIDIGAKKIFISIENMEVKSFETFTDSLKEAVGYLRTNKIETVAMEATGVYWVILYGLLEEAGFDVWLVDGKQTKQVPGRKTDVKDCQWIQQLHSYGLLNRCFVAPADIQEVRGYHRLREDHIRSASSSILHMQKALIEMNIRLKEELSQLQGASGMRIIQAILDGERDREKLLKLCHKSVIEKKSEEILRSLDGYYTEIGLFSLKHGYDTYMYYQTKIAECDKKIESVLKRINNFDTDQLKKKEISEKKKRKSVRHNAPQVEHLGGHLIHIFDGKDPTILPGITDYTWLQLYGEVGNDLQRWSSGKHFTSWLGLAPGQHMSGKMKKNKKKKGRPKAGQIFRKIAQSIIESKNIGLGVFGRRLKAKKGPAIATKAVARKLAILYYNLIVKGSEYIENGVQQYEEKLRKQRESWLIKNAKSLGYSLIPSA